jgi:hypothetical protein
MLTLASALVKNHPVNAESISHLPKARGKERLLYRHQDLTAIGKGRVNALHLTTAIQTQRQVSTPHRLGILHESLMSKKN